MQPLQAAPFRRVFGAEPQGRGLPSYSIFKEWPVSVPLEAPPADLTYVRK
jgi:hypothetical protein